MPSETVAFLLDRLPNVVGINYGGSDIKYLATMIERFSEFRPS